MTATATDPAVNGTETHVVNDPGMGGTNAEGDVQADGVEADGTQEQEPEGESPEGTEAAAEEAAPKEPGMDPAYIADLEQRVQESNFISKVVMADPDRIRAFKEWAEKDQGGGGEDWVAVLDKEAEKRFPGQEDRDAVRAIFGPMARRLKELERQVTGMAPQVQRTSQIAGAAEFSAAVAANGVSAKDQATPEYKAFLASEMRDPKFQRDRAKYPDYAGKNFARAWRASRSTAATNAAAKKHVSDLKGGRLHAGPGTNGATKVTVIDDTVPDWDKQLLALLESAKGQPVKWEYKSAQKK